MKSMKQLVLMASYGELAAQFARLEYEVSETLVPLIDKDSDHIAGYLVVSEFQMSRKVSLLLELTYLRCAHDTGVQDRIEAVSKQIRGVLPARNLFAHGLWGFFKEDFNPDVISVLDMTLKRIKPSRGQWTRARPTTFSLEDINNIMKRVGTIIRELHAIQKDFERIGLQPLHTPKTDE